jgi:hypothetical protein
MKHIDYKRVARQASMTRSELQFVWNAAAKFDRSLEIQPTLLSKLAERRVAPMRFSRSQLFRGMLACEPSLFSQFPICPSNSREKPPKLSLLEKIRSGLPYSTRARVRSNKGSIAYLTIPHVLNRWSRAKTVFGVTDLHYIGTRFDACMDTSALNDFNLLPRGTAGFQSQDSLVISSEGAVTDSHSDDHSGSNHSFVGAKLWLMWDTLEGFKYGLEEWERCDVRGRAAFDVSTFLGMRTSLWILIGPGQTMFIPAHLTHKVITLERYLGLGSFHAGLPGFVDLLIRWTRLTPLWASRSDDRCSVESITQRAIRKIQSLTKASKGERLQWGVPHLRRRLQRSDVRDGLINRDLKSSDSSNLNEFILAASCL